MSQWKDFRYRLTEIKKKYASLKKQFAENKLKFKKTSTEWTLDHIINVYKEYDEHSLIIQLAKVASMVPVTNA